MWNSTGNAINMTAGDFGVALTIGVHGIELAATDNLLLTIETADKREIKVMKEYENLSGSSVDIELELTAAESAALPAGEYFWLLDWYKDGEFFVNLILDEPFRVVSRG